MRHRLLCPVLGALTLLPACASVPSLAPIAQAAEGVATAGTSIQKAGVSAESAAVNLRKGLEGLDPAGIKELLATNANLRAELEKVQNLYLEGMGQGVVDITGRLVEVRVTRTAGDLIVNAWIDKPANQFWSGRITNRDFRLPVDIEAFMRDYPNRRCGGQTGTAAIACVGSAQRVLPMAADVYIQEVFQTYLRTAPATPAADLPASVANPRFGGSGEHKIYFEVVPVRPDANNNWSARLEIWLVDSAGRESNVFLYDVDNRRFPGHKMEEPLKPIVASLVIRAASAK